MLTIIRSGFPVLFLALIPLRWKALPRYFTNHELQVMDHLTADSDIVLASMGGKPPMPGEKGEDNSSGSSDTNEITSATGREKLSVAERGEVSRGSKETHDA